MIMLPLSATPRMGKLALLLSLVSLAILWSWGYLPRVCPAEQCGTESSLSGSPCCSFKTSHATSAVFSSSGNTIISESIPSPSDIDLSAPKAPFLSWPLARVCTEVGKTTGWTPGLTFACDNNSGGIGNIRNFILTCLRYAIDAGATGLILPMIQTRAGEELAALFKGSKQPLSYFFDETHFRRALAEACPRIEIYDSPEDVPAFGASLGANAGQEEVGQPRSKYEILTPNHLGLRGGCDARDLDRHADLFAPRFHTWLAQQHPEQHLPPVSATAPRLIRFSWGVQWTYPVWRDGPEFVATFGGLLRLREDVLTLGLRTADAVMALVAQEEREGKRTGMGFLGVHLRTEDDALSSWPDFEQQSGAYLERMTTVGGGNMPKVAYLATGNATEAARFAIRTAEQAGVRVVTKHDLLSPSTPSSPSPFPSTEADNLRAELNALSWDQQALVDFVVLLQAGYFLGVSPSSFSLNVALKRHLKAEGVYTRPWRVGGEGDGQSWLVGRYDGYWDDWLFMYESLWP